MAEGNNRICFVIAPIGEEGTETRKRSDQVLNHILKPAANELGYKAMRADLLSEPGVITTQIVQHIMEDAIVVADLTGRNPNVFYELAIRHAIRKPYVQIIQRGEEKPFDVAGIRTIEIDHHDLDSVQSAKDEIKRQIGVMDKEGYNVDSPISITIDFEKLKKSENPEQRQLADVLSALGDLRSEFALIGKKLDESISIRPTELSSKIRSMDKRIFNYLNQHRDSLKMSVSYYNELRESLMELELMMLADGMDKTDRDVAKEKITKMLRIIEDLQHVQQKSLYQNDEMIHSSPIFISGTF